MRRRRRQRSRSRRPRRRTENGLFPFNWSRLLHRQSVPLRQDSVRSRTITWVSRNTAACSRPAAQCTSRQIVQVRWGRRKIFGELKLINCFIISLQISHPQFITTRISSWIKDTTPSARIRSTMRMDRSHSNRRFCKGECVGMPRKFFFPLWSSGFVDGK